MQEKQKAGMQRCKFSKKIIKQFSIIPIKISTNNVMELDLLILRYIKQRARIEKLIFEG